MNRVSVLLVAAVPLCLALGTPAMAEVLRVADGAKSVFAEPAAPQRIVPRTVSKSAQRKRAALQQRALLEQQEVRRSSASAERNLELLRRQQAETLRAQQYGPRYNERHMPRQVLQPRQSDPNGQRLDALRQQMGDTLRDQRQIQSQQLRDTQDAMRRLRN